MLDARTHSFFADSEIFTLSSPPVSDILSVTVSLVSPVPSLLPHESKPKISKIKSRTAERRFGKQYRPAAFRVSVNVNFMKTFASHDIYIPILRFSDPITGKSRQHSGQNNLRSLKNSALFFSAQTDQILKQQMHSLAPVLILVLKQCCL